MQNTNTNVRLWMTKSKNLNTQKSPKKCIHIQSKHETKNKNRHWGEWSDCGAQLLKIAYTEGWRDQDTMYLYDISNYMDV